MSIKKIMENSAAFKNTDEYKIQQLSFKYFFVRFVPFCILIAIAGSYADNYVDNNGAIIFIGVLGLYAAKHYATKTARKKAEQEFRGEI